MIEFKSTKDNTWVMRITADRRIEVNEDIDVNEAAQKVLDAMQFLLKPQQRTWVGLTTKDQKEIQRQSVYVEGAIRMTEAKLKEKNT